MKKQSKQNVLTGITFSVLSTIVFFSALIVLAAFMKFSALNGVPLPVVVMFFTLHLVFGVKYGINILEHCLPTKTSRELVGAFFKPFTKLPTFNLQFLNQLASRKENKEG